jgi:Lar family restriction alleviation protein
MTPISDDMVELKPCPFCGGDAISDVTPVKAMEGHSVFCEDCGVAVPKEPSAALAQSHWNRRAALEGSVAVPVVGRATRMGWKRGKTDKFEVVIQLDSAPGWPIGVVWDSTPIALQLAAAPSVTRHDRLPVTKVGE